MRSRRASLLLCLFVLPLGCVADATPREPGLWASSVEFVLAWDRSRVAERTDGFEVSTDLGYTVRVRRAYLLQYSAALVDCSGVGGDVWDDVEVALRWLVESSVARAGHGDAEDASSVTAPTYLDLVATGPEKVYGARAFDEARYCRFHHLVARAYDDEIVAGAPADLALDGATVYLEGSYRSPGASEFQNFSVQTSVNYGALVDLPDALVGTLEGQAVTITLRRDLGSLFDGLAFDELETLDEDIGRQVLRNLVKEHIDVSLEVE